MSSRSGLVDSSATGAPISSSIRRIYLIAVAGSSAHERAPRVLSPNAIGKPNMAALVEWVKRYDIRIVEGAIPRVWDGSGEHSRTTLWVRDEPPRALLHTSTATSGRSSSIRSGTKWLEP